MSWLAEVVPIAILLAMYALVWLERWRRREPRRERGNIHADGA